MATTYFLCGGPFHTDDEPVYFFPGYERIEKEAPLWDVANPGELVYATFDGYWVITGDSEGVHSLQNLICPALSSEGKAGFFCEQSSSDLYEIILYERGRETEHLLSYPGESNNPNLDIEDLWNRSQEMLPLEWEEIYKLPGVWWQRSDL